MLFRSITGGFPCQSFSIAGRRRSTEDDRYLWPEMFRLIKEIKPRIVIGENVEGIINIDNGMVLRQVQTDLESENFEVQCFVIPASGIGAWHQRKRVWILAYSNNNGLHQQKINETQQSCNEQKDRLSIGNDTYVSNTESIRRRGWSGEGCSTQGWSFLSGEQTRSSLGSETERCSSKDVSNTDSKRLEGHWKEHKLRKTKQEKNSNGTGYDGRKETWWQTQSRVCRIPDGISMRVDRNRVNRIKALGNSIVPQIARELGLAILQAERN